jgi:hypothetical protein
MPLVSADRRMRRPLDPQAESANRVEEPAAIEDNGLRGVPFADVEAVGTLEEERVAVPVEEEPGGEGVPPGVRMRPISLR